MAVIVVIGASGGLGASTFTLLWARWWARKANVPVSVVDLPAKGAGLWPLVPIDFDVTWAQLSELREKTDPAELRGRLPTWSGVHLVSGGQQLPCWPPGGGRGPGSMLEAVPAVVASLATGGHVIVETSLELALQTGLHEIADRLCVVSGLLPSQLADTERIVAGSAKFAAPGLVVRRMHKLGVNPATVQKLSGWPVHALLPQHRQLPGRMAHDLGPKVSKHSAYGRVLEALLPGLTGTKTAGKQHSTATPSSGQTLWSSRAH